MSTSSHSCRARRHIGQRVIAGPVQAHARQCLRPDATIGEQTVSGLPDLDEAHFFIVPYSSLWRTDLFLNYPDYGMQVILAFIILYRIAEVAQHAQVEGDLWDVRVSGGQPGKARLQGKNLRTQFSESHGRIARGICWDGQVNCFHRYCLSIPLACGSAKVGRRSTLRDSLKRRLGKMIGGVNVISPGSASIIGILICSLFADRAGLKTN